jgi:inorganic pyrophosphatase
MGGSPELLPANILLPAPLALPVPTPIVDAAVPAEAAHAAVREALASPAKVLLPTAVLPAMKAAHAASQAQAPSAGEQTVEAGVLAEEALRPETSGERGGSSFDRFFHGRGGASADADPVDESPRGVGSWKEPSPAYDGVGGFRALIEITKGSKDKYELDKKTGRLRLDRVLDYAEGYPADYGFIPQTYADDGDPLDVLVLGENSLAPLAFPRVRAIGVVRMVDQGKADDKIIAVREDDPVVGSYRDLRELPAGVVEHLQRFFREYKASEGKEVVVGEAQGFEAARAIIERSFADYRALHARPAEGPVGARSRPVRLRPIPFNGRLFPPVQFTEDGRMGEKLIAALDATRETMDLSLLELNHRGLYAAVSRARKRGVKVRIVVDAAHMYPVAPGQTRSAELQRLIDEGFDIRVLRGGREYGLMHNKFAILDGRLLWSGSANWSHAADTFHQENVVYTDDAHRVEGFQASFDWMWGLARPVGERAGVAEGGVPADATRPVVFNGVGLPAYVFAPGVETEEWLLKAIAAARVSIDVAMFSCTSQRLREALLQARERQPGVKVRIVFDAVQYVNLIDMAWFFLNGFDVRIAFGLMPKKGAMHNKFVVFDGVLVQTGSYNWTENAKFNNFENAQFFDDPAIVAAYAGYFERVRARGRAAREAGERTPPLPRGEGPMLPSGLSHERRSTEGNVQDRGDRFHLRRVW